MKFTKLDTAHITGFEFRLPLDWEVLKLGHAARDA